MHRRQAGPPFGPQSGPPSGPPPDVTPNSANRPPSLAPPGVTPNYVNPDTIGHQVTITGLTLIILSTLFVVARLSIKVRVVKKRSWDDYWVVFAWGNPYNHKYEEERMLEDHTNAGSRGTLLSWVPPLGHPAVRAFEGRDAEEREMAASIELIFIADMLYLISIMSTKIAILLLYKALFGIKRSFRYLCYGMMAIVISYCLIFFFILAFNCNPVQKTWHVQTFKGPAKCFAATTVQFVIGGFNIATDLVILVMPMPIILHLQMDLKRKIGLLVIFSTGILYVVSQKRKQLPEYVSYLRSKSTYRSTKDGGSGYAPSKGPFKGVLGYHSSTESGVELVNNAPKNGAYISTNPGERGLTHENGTITRETDMQVFYSSRPDASV
ncbi:MAG: hypothetical protein Q9208_001211 [Pyrenodesmia sp. 3 TL-2023]